MSGMNIATGPAGEAEQTFTGMRAVVVGAGEALACAFAAQRMTNDLPVRIEVQAGGEIDNLPDVLAGAQIAVLAGGPLTEVIARQCKGLLHVIFLSETAQQGTPVEMLEKLGISPHAFARPSPATPEGLADAAIEQCRRIVSPTGG